MAFNRWDYDSFLEELTASQLQDWLTYMQMEPWGFDIDNLRTGIIASSVFNSQRTNDNDPIVTPSAFFQFDTNEKQYTDDEELERNMTLYAEAINKAQGG